MKRSDLLGLFKFAGYHGDRAAFTRLFIEHRVNRSAATAAYRAGRLARGAGQRCGCSDCAAAAQADGAA